MTYSQVLDELFRLRTFGWKLGLETTRDLLARLGNPQQDLKFIHIAGTNGKGSVAAMCAAILATTGRRVGLYTSPHLVSFCERFQVDGQWISEADVVRLVSAMRPAIDHVAGDPTRRSPTFFEVATALALLWFREQQVDVVAWETGLGGRLDATNIVAPLVSVITNIGMDHAQYLGDTLAAIAGEKCGIIKPGVPVVTAARHPDALSVIRQTCDERKAPLTEVVSPWTGPVGLAGEHQRWNAATAVAALLAAGFALSADQIDKGLQGTRWPGRFQVIGGDPPIVVDGAHNPDAVRVLVETMEREFPGRPVTVVLGVLRDKDCRAVCGRLLPLAQRVVVVPVQSERSCDPADLAAVCRELRPELDARSAAGLADGLEQARCGTPRHGVILVTGSLFLVGEALGVLTPAPVNPRELVMQ